MRFKLFRNKVDKIILSHMDDKDFNVGKLAEHLDLSRSQTLRKIKMATGFSANEYIREMRLKKSLEYLQNDKLTVSEIAYKVGFNNPSYFNKCFHDRYEHAPGAYRKEVLAEELTPEIKKHVIYSVLIFLVVCSLILAVVLN